MIIGHTPTMPDINDYYNPYTGEFYLADFERDLLGYWRNTTDIARVFNVITRHFPYSDKWDTIRTDNYYENVLFSVMREYLSD